MISAETIARQYPPQTRMNASRSLELVVGGFQPLDQIPQGIYYGQFDRLESINRAMYDRNLSQGNAGLRPNLESRSVPTKNIRFSAVQEHRTSSVPLVPLERFPPYNPHNEQVFAPIQAKGPSDYFLANVDAESTLRNQFFALQHGADAGVYVPSSNSDLYRVHVPTYSHPDAQPFPSLFQRDSLYTTTNPYIDESPHIGKDTFHNCTQTQLRSMIPK